MAARSVQISLDQELLARVDRQPLARRQGRSALIRAALEAYLANERRASIDGAYARAYGGPSAAAVQAELGPLMKGQKWPKQ